MTYNPTGTVTSGTYTPTLFNGTNIATSTAYLCQYMRVGSVVTVSGQVDIDTTATGASSLGMSLPIASNFANQNECGGTFASIITASNSGGIQADGANDRANFSWLTVTSTADAYYFSFTYRVI